jgi:UDP-2-acetamido-3-amino-2,3-dideoxy-glucuronate N-acetyltransferase
MDNLGSMAGRRPGRERHVAVVGAGRWGRELARAFDRLGVLHLVCDCDAARLNALATDGGAQRCTSYEECLKNSQVDAVAIAAPAALHFDMARSALAAGKDVLVEMPPALSIREGQELVDLAAAANRVLMAGNVLRYHPAVCKLKELIEAGELGRVEYICSNRLTAGPLRPEESVLWSFAPHEISVILDLLGEMPIAASCQGGDYARRGVTDVTISQLVFAGGIRAQVFVSRMQPFREHWLVVVGSEKMAVFDESARQALMTYPRRDCPVAVPPPDEAAGEPVAVDVTEPMTAECLAFLESLDARRPAANGGPEELRVLKVLDACSRSLSSDGVKTMIQPEVGARPILLGRGRTGRRATTARAAGHVCLTAGTV